MSQTISAKARKRIAVITAMLCVAVFVFCLFRSDIAVAISANSIASGEDYVRIIDVGQGDSILIHSNGHSALIDTGPPESANDLCASLHDNNVKSIDVMFLSHLHSDHTGGISSVLESFQVKNLILPELSTNSEGIYSAQLAINEVTRNGGGVYSGIQGMNLDLGEFEITVLESFGKMEAENNRSLIIMAEIDNRRFLFTGDAEEPAENALLEDNIDIKCDVLKVAHHGSSTSSCKKFLREANPKYAAISVGKENFYGHPNKDVLDALRQNGTKVYRTDKKGDITFFVKNGKINPQTER